MSVFARLPVIAHSEIPSVNGFPRYSEPEMARRLDAVRGWLDDRGLDLAIVGGVSGGLETSVQYFSNWAPLVESFVVVPRIGDPVLFVRLWNHLPDARLVSSIPDVRYGGDTGLEAAETVAEFVKALGHAAGGIGWIGGIGASTMDALRRDLPSSSWVDLGADYSALRLVKSDEEMTYIRIASRFNDESIEAMRAGIVPGMREYEIPQLIESVYNAARGTNLIHFTMSTPMSDPRYCVPHQQQPDRIIREGDVVVTEISTSFWGYAGQILRSFTVASDPTPAYQDLFDVATRTYNDILEILRPGVTVGEILDAADSIDAAGYSILDDLVHGQGGAYLPPILRTRQTRGATHPDDFAYPAGSVIVVQPNVTSPDYRAGVQLGNAVRISDDGVEVLQDAPMAFIRCA